MSRTSLHQPRPVLDAFFSEYLGCDISSIAPGHAHVIESPPHHDPELFYAEAFALWMVTTQSRTVISVRGRLLENVSRLARSLGIERYRDPATMKRFVVTVSKGLGIRQGVSSTSGPILYCTPDTLRVWTLHPCHQVTLHNISDVRSTGLFSDSLNQSVDEGSCYAAYHERQPVSLAGTSPVPHMSDSIADMNIPGTLEDYQGQGFGRTAVSHSTRAVLSRCKAPVYMTSDDNIPSKRTAQLVGYREYGWQFRIRLANVEHNGAAS